MDWQNIFTSKRIGQAGGSEGPRSGFQKDFDRLIFSSAFRRLQNKTQVFPLPGSTFVHNRLTHSLEVASVGRSLGNLAGEMLAGLTKDTSADSYEFYKYELANVIAAGCLAHDIGNPAFGHSGEKAISRYFINNAGSKVEGKELQAFFSVEEWADLSNFEGNANAIRVLTHKYKGRLIAGLGLTYTTLASIIKYPCSSTMVDGRFRHRKKYGFFQSEHKQVIDIAKATGMLAETEDLSCFKRHPFVYLVEAADDICYSIIDLEDAHRLGILSNELVSNSLFYVLDAMQPYGYNRNKVRDTFSKIDDENEGIAYLRSKAIDFLTNRAAAVFWENRQNILDGTFNSSLLEVIEQSSAPLQKVIEISVEKIYNHETVLEVEIAGYNVMNELLHLFVPALLKNKADEKDKKVLKLLPIQYTGFKESTAPYIRVMSAIDMISGMTDLYATELFRKLKGIDIPKHS